MKKSVVFLFSFILVFSVLMVSAEEIDVSAIDENAVLEETEGITPDSFLYGVDKFFDNFADAVKVRQEKVAEIRAMIEAEKYEEALEALEEYRKHAEEFEREVSPEQRDEARRSAAAIYNVLKSLEAQIPDEFKEELFDNVIKEEKRIVTAAEIAGKIKVLCEELSELDPLQYSRVCKTGDDSPKWQQSLDRELTEEQKEEAKEFFDIMLQCFETSGGTCRCEDISITPFANKCSQIAPLAYACDVEDDEAACDKMDEIEDEEPIEDLLPDYLKDVLRQIEDRFEDEQFDNHAPRECREAGATTRQECMEVMFKLNAPSECIEALERGEIDLDNEREARESCEGIMFDLEAPQECLDEGLTDFRECGKLMFQLYAPQECIDAGLTGENRRDERDCGDLVGDDFRRGPNRGPGPGGYTDFNCQEIQDSTERLECYDRAASQVDSFHGGFDDSSYDGPCFTSSDWENKKQECRSLYGDHAGDEPIYGDSGDGYECVVDAKCVDFGQYKDEGEVGPAYDCSLLDCFEGYYCDPYGGCIQDDSGDYGYEFSECNDGCLDECPGASRTECVSDGLECACYYDEPVKEEPIFEEEVPVEETPIEPTLTDSNTESTATAAVISENAFFDYYYR